MDSIKCIWCRYDELHILIGNVRADGDIAVQVILVVLVLLVQLGPVGELEAGLRGAEVRLEEAGVDEGRERGEVEVGAEVDEAQPGVDPQGEGGAARAGQHVVQQQRAAVQVVAVAGRRDRGGAAVPRRGEASHQHGEVEEAHDEAEHGEEDGPALAVHLVPGGEHGVAVVGAAELQVELGGGHHGGHGGCGGQHAAAVGGRVLVLAGGGQQEAAQRELHRQEHEAARLPDEGVRDVVLGAGEVQQHRDEAAESGGEAERRHEAVDHLQHGRAHGAQPRPDARQPQEEEEEEHDVGGQDQEVPHPQVGAAHPAVEDRFTRRVVLDQARVEEGVLEEWILGGEALGRGGRGGGPIRVAEHQVRQLLEALLEDVLVGVHVSVRVW